MLGFKLIISSEWSNSGKRIICFELKLFFLSIAYLTISSLSFESLFWNVFLWNQNFKLYLIIIFWAYMDPLEITKHWLPGRDQPYRSPRLKMPVFCLLKKIRKQKVDEDERDHLEALLVADLPSNHQLFSWLVHLISIKFTHPHTILTARFQFLCQLRCKGELFRALMNKVLA